MGLGIKYLNLVVKIDGKMTLAFDSGTYTNLLIKYQPKVIKTEAENDRAVALAEELDRRSHRTPEEESLLELLLILIEKFEEVHYPIPQSSGVSILLHLIEENGLSSDDLAGILGERVNITDMIDGKQSMNRSQVRSLADYFNIDEKLLTN
ncbi:transcriptional regulator [Oscillatoria sp. FACHB-1406]|uniref:helix-turn-helix domain-containing protein n=1 Tax=Oscillatoria sp. FACHB-1406 TaxID=2692846 RepID=UPI001684276A|nr:transcriptional regulator [Oscillatoria sp. FACHB-1406]MBD2578652.1 transcriptional regulator [Oscillatoria sp. FACHB-1406]